MNTQFKIAAAMLAAKTLTIGARAGEGAHPVAAGPLELKRVV